jgi:hypothetical protein
LPYFSLEAAVAMWLGHAQVPVPVSAEVFMKFQGAWTLHPEIGRLWALPTHALERLYGEYG